MGYVVIGIKQIPVLDWSNMGLCSYWNQTNTSSGLVQHGVCSYWNQTGTYLCCHSTKVTLDTFVHVGRRGSGGGTGAAMKIEYKWQVAPVM